MSEPRKSGKDLKEAVLRILGEIAPDADLSRLKPDENLREALDIDSMDFLRFASKIEQELGVPVPESDYRKLGTLAACVRYLEAASKIPSSTPAPFGRFVA